MAKQGRNHPRCRRLAVARAAIRPCGNRNVGSRFILQMAAVATTEYLGVIERHDKIRPQCRCTDTMTLITTFRTTNVRCRLAYRARRTKVAIMTLGACDGGNESMIKRRH